MRWRGDIGGIIAMHTEKPPERAGPARRAHFYSLDPDFRFTYVSDSAAALWGRDQRELLGKVIWDAFAMDHEGRERHQVAMAQRTSQAYVAFSAQFERWFSFYLCPLVTGGLICFFDETKPPQSSASDEIAP